MPSHFAVTADARTTQVVRVLRLCASFAVVVGLAACSGTPAPRMSATQQAQKYAARAQRNYVPPGPASDPWGPYIHEASGKYDVPDRWIREVIRAESSGKVFDTSAPGAMGLMQLMPDTFDELRARYGLGDDPYDPHDNIMAGTAYLREMYDLYGSPGFLAAYNAGPRRLDDYLTRHQPLPLETRNYVAKIGARMGDVQPLRISPASQYAMNRLPINIPPGPRQSGGNNMPVALADNRRNTPIHDTIQMASLSLPPAQSPPPSYLALPPLPPARTQVASSGAPPNKSGMALIPHAMADTLPRQAGGPATWAIQVGSFDSAAHAHSAADAARSKAQLTAAHSAVEAKKKANTTLYQARVTSMTREAALEACEKLSKSHGSCIVLSPASQL